MSEQSRAEVRFEFASGRSVVPEELKRRVLRRPAVGVAGKLPYHMDGGQATVLAGLARGSAVLEIGCGGGQNRSWMRERGLRYLGTDVSKTRVYEHLQAFGGPDVLADAHFLPIRAQSVDCVYAAAVHEHLACPLRAAQEVWRVLRPGGVYLGNCSFMEPWHDESFFHMSPNGVIELLLAARFEIECVYPGAGWHGFVAMPRMAFAGPLRGLAPLGRLFHAVYRAQTLVANARRRSQGRAGHDALRVEAKIAGAMTWIARKPGGTA
jgi:SAM-dependent methyltransferase